MIIIPDAFEQSIEDNAEKFVPLSSAEKNKVENIIEMANKTRNINIRIAAYDIDKAKQLSAENGIITLTPFSDEKPRFDHLIGMFSEGKISINDFLEEKQLEKELEM